MKLYTAKVRVSTKKQEPSATEDVAQSTPTPPQVCSCDTRVDDIVIVARDMEEAIDVLRGEIDDAEILCVHASPIRVLRSQYV